MTDRAKLPACVRDYLEAYETGRAELIDRCVGPGALYMNVTHERGMRADGIDGVREIMRGIHELYSGIRITLIEAHVDPADNGEIVRLAYMLDATSEVTIKDGFQSGQHIHLAGRMALKVEVGKLVKIFESS